MRKEDGTSRVQGLGLPVDITANVDGVEILTPDPSDPSIGFPNRPINSLSYAVYRLFVSSSPTELHWRGSHFFESFIADWNRQEFSRSPSDPVIDDFSLSDDSNNESRHYAIWKRFSDFDVLQRYLTRRYPEVPSLPPKTFGRNLGQSQIR